MSSNNNHHPPVGQMTSTSGGLTSSSTGSERSGSVSGGGNPNQHVQYSHNQLQQNDQRGESTKSFNDRFRAFFKNFGKGTPVVAGSGAGLGVQGPGGG